MEDIRITLIVENETPPGLVAEHGFAAWIETDGECFLFDTGQGTALEHNAGALGIDLAKAGALILSHGHYDHTGGVPAFLAANTTAPIYCGPGATQRRYACHPDHEPRLAGMVEHVLHELDALPSGRRIELAGPHRPRPGMGITGPVPRTSGFEDTGGPFYLDADKSAADLITDDLSLWFETPRGLVILCGCCHSGLVNTVDYVRQVSGIEQVHGIVGGLHLLQASEERLQQTLRFLAACEPDFLTPCHCTGAQVVERLRREFGERVVRPGYAGMTIEAPAQHIGMPGQSSSDSESRRS